MSAALSAGGSSADPEADQRVAFIAKVYGLVVLMLALTFFLVVLLQTREWQRSPSIWRLPRVFALPPLVPRPLLTAPAKDATCRICQEVGAEPLAAFCGCKGSLALVHGSCLERWRQLQSRGDRCELCGQLYSVGEDHSFAVGSLADLLVHLSKHKDALRSSALYALRRLRCDPALRRRGVAYGGTVLLVWTWLLATRSCEGARPGLHEAFIRCTSDATALGWLRAASGAVEVESAFVLHSRRSTTLSAATAAQALTHLRLCPMRREDQGALMSLLMEAAGLTRHGRISLQAFQVLCIQARDRLALLRFEAGVDVGASMVLSEKQIFSLWEEFHALEEFNPTSQDRRSDASAFRPPASATHSAAVAKAAEGDSEEMEVQLAPTTPAHSTRPTLVGDFMYYLATNGRPQHTQPGELVIVHIMPRSQCARLAATWTSGVFRRALRLLRLPSDYANSSVLSLQSHELAPILAEYLGVTLETPEDSERESPAAQIAELEEQPMPRPTPARPGKEEDAVAAASDDAAVAEDVMGLSSQLARTHNTIMRRLDVQEALLRQALSQGLPRSPVLPRHVELEHYPERPRPQRRLSRASSTRRDSPKASPSEGEEEERAGEEAERISNAIFIGIDVHHSVTYDGERPFSYKVVQYTYTVLFCAELMVRMVALRWQFFWSEDWMWSLLDVFIVVTSLWEVAVDIISMVYQENGGIDSISGLTNMMLGCPWLFLTSIISTLKALFWALILLGLIVYVFAVLFTQAVYDYNNDNNITAIADLDEELDFLVPTLGVRLQDVKFYQSASTRYWGSLAKSMLSLFMSIAGGVSWEEAAGCASEAEAAASSAQAIKAVLSVLFQWHIGKGTAMPYMDGSKRHGNMADERAVYQLMDVNFSARSLHEANARQDRKLFTGSRATTNPSVFCQSAIESAQNDHAMVVQSMIDNKTAHLTKIKALFSEIGAEESGVLTIGVFEEKIKTPAVRQYFEALGLDVWDAWSFFKLLDVDGGGAVEIEEFFLG
eukprot:s469_g3.t1